MVSQRLTPEKMVLEKKRHFACTERMLILPIFLVGVHQWNSEGAASKLFRRGARQGRKGSSANLSEILK